MVFAPTGDVGLSGGQVAGRRRSDCDGVAGVVPPEWCGKVLAAGGEDDDFDTADQLNPTGAQLYDPKDNKWAATAPLNVGRVFPFFSPLGDGRVLLTGGEFGNSAEIYDPRLANPTWKTTIGKTLAIRSALANKGAALLPDGRVLIVGGNSTLVGAELFDPSTESFAPVAGCADCGGRVSLTPLPDGRLLVISQVEGSGSPSPARLYNPAPTPSVGSFVSAAPSELGSGGTLISGTSETCGQKCGKVLVVSRRLAGATKNKVQVYTPPS